jgi:cobyrinic acid a,c-diamide synthase
MSEQDSIMIDHNRAPHGLVVAGLGGGSGKSVVAVGLVAALKEEGRRVVPFKKGPDYIDAGWLSLAASSPCYNLDPFLMPEEAMLKSFSEHAVNAEMIIIEGNRGLFDGVNIEGSFSTAELACFLKLPVLLVVDCTKTTRTVAALVLGCKQLDPRLSICGVVLNKIGSERHEKIVRESVEKYTGIPVLGAVRRMKQDIFPMRHLGVTPFQEYEGTETALKTLSQVAKDSLDIPGIIRAMKEPVCKRLPSSPADKKEAGEESLRIGVIRDAAFQFYYQENIEALESKGAEIIEVNAMKAQSLPELDALYIGGGFPETSAKLLSENMSFRQSIKETAEKGLPIYAECGGLIYLGESISLEGTDHLLVGIFPVRFTLEKRPQAHGYTVLKVREGNPFYSPGTRIKGHEFRYSRVAEWGGSPEEMGFDMERGVGFEGNCDGLVYKNVLALYTHVHAVATPEWTEGMIKQAREYKKKKLGIRN